MTAISTFGVMSACEQSERTVVDVDCKGRHFCMKLAFIGFAELEAFLLADIFTRDVFFDLVDFI